MGGKWFSQLILLGENGRKMVAGTDIKSNGVHSFESVRTYFAYLFEPITVSRYSTTVYQSGEVFHHQRTNLKSSFPIGGDPYDVTW